MTRIKRTLAPPLLIGLLAEKKRREKKNIEKRTENRDLRPPSGLCVTLHEARSSPFPGSMSSNYTSQERERS